MRQLYLITTAYFLPLVLGSLNSSLRFPWPQPNKTYQGGVPVASWVLYDSLAFVP